MKDSAARNRDRQLQELVDHLSQDFDPIAELRNIYPNHIIPAHQFNKKTASDRRAYGEFTSLNAIKNITSIAGDLNKRRTRPRAKNWGELLVLYVVDKNPEQIERARILMEKRSFRNPRILVALPRNADRICEVLLRYKAARQILAQQEDPRDSARWKDIAIHLGKALKAQIRWDKWVWFYMGGVLETEGNVTESEIISLLLDSLYPHLFNPGCRALARVHTSSAADRRQIRRAVEMILDPRASLSAARNADEREGGLFRCMAQLGLLRQMSPEGYDETWEVVEELPETSPLTPVWKHLMAEILEPAKKNQPVSFTVVRNLLTEPFGMTAAMVKVVFALFWRRYYSSICLYNLIEDELLRIEPLTFQRLTDILRRPEYWKIGLRAVTEDDEPYLDLVIRIFTRGRTGFTGTASLEERAQQAITQWYKEKPPFIYKREFKTPVVREFIAMLEKHRSDEPAHLLLIHLPIVLNLDVTMLNLFPDVPEFASPLKKAVHEVDSAFRGFLDELAWKLFDLFIVDIPSHPAHPITCESLAECLHMWLRETSIQELPESIEVQAEQLINLVRTAGEKQERFLNELPKILGMKALQEWQADYSAELLARVRVLLLRIRTARYMTMLAGTDPEARRRAIVDNLARTLKQAQFSQEDSERILRECLSEAKNSEAS